MHRVMKDLDAMQMPTLSPQEFGGYWVQDIVVLNKHGLHARPSAKIFEKILMPYSDKLELHFDVENRESIHIRSVFDLMSLGLEQNTKLRVRIKFHGPSEDGATPERKILNNIYELFLSFCED
jgi:phosphotransferase system HPr (HPr) family protein